MKRKKKTRTKTATKGKTKTTTSDANQSSVSQKKNARVLEQCGPRSYALDYGAFADFVDSVRDAKHYSWRDVAKVSGVSRTTLHRLNAAIPFPISCKNAERLFRFCGLSVATALEQFKR